jgi:ComF family protein
MPNLFNLILDILFPKRCPGCLALIKDDSNFCNHCLNQIKIYNSLFCFKCGGRLYDFKKICHPNQKFILGAATNYNNITEKAIHLLKFKYISRTAQPLANLLINYFNQILNYTSLNILNFIVIPIPLSKKRLRWRGFNQSELIAQIFANYFNLKLETDILFRVKHSKPQSEINDLNQRKLNVNKCFQIQNKDKIKNKNILLIDDIITTGSTVNEAVSVLKSAGARKIIVLAICKA